MRSVFRKRIFKEQTDKKSHMRLQIGCIISCAVIGVIALTVCLHVRNIHKAQSQAAALAYTECANTSLPAETETMPASSTTEPPTETTTQKPTTTAAKKTTTAKKTSSATKKKKAASTPKTPTTKVSGNFSGKGYISVSVVYQNPELPTGCEITSLTMVLRHFGYPADKCDLADNYLPKGDKSKGNPYKVFLGNPRNAKDYGCYAPPIVEAGKKYIADHGGKHEVKNISGASLYDLYRQIDNKTPVIVWATDQMQMPRNSRTWQSGGQTITWKAPLHCLVLIGYDAAAGKVTFANPLHGVVSYAASTFEARYKAIGQQAVVILKKASAPTTKPHEENTTSAPTTEPTTKPTTVPTTEPATEPTTEPTAKPVAEPIAEFHAVASMRSFESLHR